MKKIFSLLLLTFLILSCKKEESNKIIWEKSFGEGVSYFIEQTSDSGFISCGTLSGYPCLLKFNKNRIVEADYTSSLPGLFSSARYFPDCFIAVGNSDGRMLISKISTRGTLIWDTLITAESIIEKTSLVYEGNGIFLAVGSADIGSYDNNESGLLFVRMDTSCQVIGKKEIPGNLFLSSGNSCSDLSGNIYLALTTIAEGAKPKAVVEKYNHDLNMLWETELYNNPNFTAECHDVVTDASGKIYVTGNTEASGASGVLKNSFLASLDAGGSTTWKKYIENSNSGAAVVFSDEHGIIMMNSNCFIINLADPQDGTDAGIIRMFSQCDSYTTDAFGYDIAIGIDGNLLYAGSLGGNFYIALKSPQ